MSTQTVNSAIVVSATTSVSGTLGSGTVVLGGPVSGAGALSVSSGATLAGKLTLSGSNSFTGGIIVGQNNGFAAALNINNAAALGSGTLALTNGAVINNTSGNAISLSSNNAITLGTNLTFGGSQDLTFGSGTVTSLGSVINMGGTGSSLTFGGQLSNSGQTTYSANGPGNTVAFNGVTLNNTVDTVARAVTFAGSGNVNLTGGVVDGNAFANVLAYNGSGIMTLAGANSFTGALRVNFGTVKIDANTATFASANAVSVGTGGSKLEYDNTTSTGARSLTLGTLTPGSGIPGEFTVQSTRTAAQTMTLTFGSGGTFGPGAGAGFNFVTVGGVNGTDNSIRLSGITSAGFLSGRTYYNGADFAAMSAPGGSGGFVRALAYGTDANTVAVNTITAGRHVKLTSTQAAQNTISLLTLNLSGNTDFSLNSAQTVTLTQFGLLKSGTGSSTISGGAGFSQGTNELSVRTDTASDLLTISNVINSTATTALTKSGAGTLVLTGTNSFGSGAAVNITNGALRATDGVGLTATSILQLRGGVFESNGTFNRTVGTAAGNVNWSTASGGFAANGGALNVQLNGGTGSVTWNGSSMVSDGRELIFGSATADNVVDFQNGLNLGSGGVQPRVIRVLDNTNSTADRARISGAITNTTAGMSIVKEGAGILELTSNSNTYSGGTVVNAGTLLVNNTLGSATGTGAVTVNAGTILGGTGSISGATTIAGSLRPGNSIGTLTVANDVTWDAGNAWVFELGTSAATLGDANTGSSTQDLLNITGGSSDFLMGSGSTWTFDFSGGGTAGWYKVVDWSGTTDFTSGLNTQFVATNLGVGLTGQFTVDTATSALYLNVVPEPGTCVLLLGAVGMLMLARRRRV